MSPMTMGPLRALGVCLLLAGLLPGQTNQAISLTGTATGGFVRVPHADDLVPACGIAVEAWVFYDPAGVVSAYPTIVRKNPAPQLESYNLRVTGGRLQWVVNLAGQGLLTITDPAPFPGAIWTHVAATFDGIASALLVNGAPAAQGTAGSATTLQNTGGELRIGKGDDPNAEHWAGLIDEVRIWRFARDAGEITSTLGFGLAALPGLVASWRLDGTYLDSAGSHHGAAVGAVPFQPSSVFLQAVAPGAVAVLAPGSPSQAGCTVPALGVTSLPKVGNPFLALVCCGAPPGGGGLLALSDGALAVPLGVAGAWIWVNVLTPQLLLLPVTADARGVARVPMPVPGIASLVGLQLYVQIAWADPCTIAGASASDTLAVMIQP